MAFNPSQSQPVVIIDKMNLLADPITLGKYICRAYQMQELYPMSDEEEEAETRQTIDHLLEVNQVQFKRTTERLTKLEIQKRTRAVGKLPALNEAKKAEFDEEWRAESYLLTLIFEQLENQLVDADTGFLVTDKISFADLTIFHELVNVTTITEIKPDPDTYPNLDKWY